MPLIYCAVGILTDVCFQYTFLMNSGRWQSEIHSIQFRGMAVMGFSKHGLLLKLNNLGNGRILKSHL